MKRILTLGMVLLLFLTTPVKAEDIPPLTEPIITLNNQTFYSQNFLLMDQDTGTVLAEQNGYEKVHPASITKVITMITAIEMMEAKNISLKDVYTLPEEVFTDIPMIASVAGFEPYDKLTMEDILYGMAMPSGADATNAMSMHLTGSPSGLVGHMNQKAKEIGMTNSNFVNTSGLDDDEHLSTPYDLAKLVQYAMKNETFKKIYTTISYTTSPTTRYPSGIPYVNKSIETAHDMGFPTLYGAKSGTTDLAERSLSSVASKDGINLIFISTNAPFDDEVYNTNVMDAITIYKRVFDDFRKYTAIPKKTIINEISVKHAKNKFPVQFAEDVNVFVPKTLADADVNVVVKPLDDAFTAPIEANSVMAQVEVQYSNKVIFRDQVSTTEEIPVRLSKIILDYVVSFAKILLIVAAILAVLVLIIRQVNILRYRRRREKRLEEMRRRRNQ